jgi:hypothetical protein
LTATAALQQESYNTGFGKTALLLYLRLLLILSLLFVELIAHAAIEKNKPNQYYTEYHQH